MNNFFNDPSPESDQQSKTDSPKSNKKNDTLFISISVGVTILVCIAVAGFILLSRNTMKNSVTVSPAASMVTAVPLPTTSVYVAKFESGTCGFKVPDQANVTCGVVNVPQDRNGNSATLIQLAVAVYHSDSSTPQSDPILYLQGGPGGVALDWSVGVYETVIKPLLVDRDFIVFDPRGVGYSKPNLKCDEVKHTYFSDVEGKLPTDQKQSYYEGAVLNCKNNYQGMNVDVSTYNSVSMAADAKDVLLALGHQKANIYGISYGTRVAQFLMRSYPDLVRSVVLDSVVPVEVQLLKPEASADSDQLLRSLFDACKTDAACSAAYPDLEATYNETIQQLNGQPVKVTVALDQQRSVEQKVDGMAFRNVIAWSLRNSQTIALIPHLIYRTHAGDESLLNYATSFPLFTFDGLSTGVYVSVNCHDQVFASPTEGLDESLYSLCQLWGVQQPVTGENEAVTSEIPTLILAGSYDPVTPVAFAHQLAAHLTHSFMVEIPNDGHVPSVNGSSTCPVTLIAAFIKDPGIAPDTHCVDALMNIKFDVPYSAQNPVSFKAINLSDYQINTKVPADWTAAQFGFYYRNPAYGDLTQIGIQRAAVPEAQWLNWLSTNFAGNWGFDQAATLRTHHSANGLTWSVYDTSSHGNPVVLAFAKSADSSVMVLMMYHNDEQEALYKTVFLPILDSTVSSK